MMTFYTEKIAFDYIEGCSNGGRLILFWSSIFDTLVYSVLIASAIALGVVLTVREMPRPTGSARWLVLLPLLAILADWSENLLILVMIIIYPGRNPALGTYVGVITPIKWALYYLAGALAVPGLLLAFGRSFPRLVPPFVRFGQK
jgi:hypothetical protein